jgi:ribose/xylose/arabinose/galactoside ABC-type transport system permease subunit
LTLRAPKTERIGVLAALALLGLYLSWASPYFLTGANMLNIGNSIAVIGIVAAGSTLVLLGGGIDISIGSTVALSGVAAGRVLDSGGGWITACVVAVLTGGVAGLINGALITGLKVNPLIATLGTLSIYRGLAFIASDGVALPASDRTFLNFGSGKVFGIPNPLLVMAVVFAGVWLLLVATTIGRNIYAIGGNPDAARLAGIPLSKYNIGLYVASGLLAGLGSVVLTARLGSAQPLAAAGLELDAIAACVLGGIALSGGVGTVGGTVLGVLVLGTVNNGLAILQVDSFYQYLARGGVLVIAVAFDQYNTHRRTRGLAATVRRRERSATETPAKASS